MTVTVGRPTKYDPLEHPKLARELTGIGKTQMDMAQLFDVARSTIEEWINRHPEFSVAIKLGKEDACDNVERALYERAVGYQHQTVKPIVVSDGKDAGSHIEMVDLTVRYPPDTAAAMSWLKNKRPDEWKDKQQVEHSGKITLEQSISQTIEQQKKLEKDASVLSITDGDE